jgi:hypothetical protein
MCTYVDVVEDGLLEEQSGTEEPYTITTGDRQDTQQTMGFTTQNPAYGYTQDSMPDPSFGTADTGNQALSDFFARPLRIADFEWSTTDTSFLESFNPWTLFFNNVRVINRINNYNLLRAKLHLRFLINGNGFHYGRLIVSYQPLHTVDSFTLNRAFFRQDIIGASQQPHIYMDPTTSLGGDMVLPFFWEKNALSIPDAEWQEMGIIDIRALTDLKHANGATDQVTITVMAWAEDVSLSIPTVADSLVLQPQSGDEYGNGPISRPASILARASGALRNAPVIGMYARATEMAANAVSAIATTFGYSRPAILDDIVPYKPTLLGNLANTNCPDSTVKLTVDAKQEVTVDPRVTGLGNTDEMSITGIACRESYLTSFTWSTLAQSDAFLWNARVSPMLWDELQTGNNTEIHMTACAFATLPFKYWKGSMKFRFQFVASHFHKGRVRIVYDPNTAAGESFNTSFQQIVDIAEEKDVTVEVGWGVRWPYLQHQNPGTDALPFSVGPFNFNDELSNGVIYLEVLNRLTVPNSSVNNNIQVNVFVSACDDFEVANPTSSFIDDYSWEPTPAPALNEILENQSGTMTSADQEDTKEPSAPVSSTVETRMAAKPDPTDGLNVICFGEKISSFRQMIKRYSLHTLFTNTATTGPSIITRTTGDFPFYRGYVPGGAAVHIEPVGGNAYNYARMTLLNYLTPAYVARRGGIRYKTVWLNQLALGNVNQSLHTVERTTDATGYSLTNEQFFMLNGDQSELAGQVRKWGHGYSGMAAQPVLQNPVLEYELPYNRNRRFYNAKAVNMSFGTNGNQYHTYKHLSNPSTTEQPVYADYVAGAEDFSLFFFTGAPVLYYAPSDPV